MPVRTGDDLGPKKQKARAPRVIAIDGPGGAGKSSVGERVAAALGYRLVDTGLMYRALTWAALRRGLDPTDEAALAALARSARVEVSPLPPGSAESHAVFVDGADATPHVREPEVEGAVSLVSRVPAVREEMVRRQRELATMEPGVVIIGRDIGTVVVPDAGLKIYLDASPETRARRRQEQLERRGRDVNRSAVAEAMARRDSIDSTREVSPLRPAADAHVIDTDRLSLDEVVERVMELVRACRS